MSSLHFNCKRLLKIIICFRNILPTADQAVGSRQSLCILGIIMLKQQPQKYLSSQQALYSKKVKRPQQQLSSIKEILNTSVGARVDLGLGKLPLIVFQRLAYVYYVLVIGQVFLSCGCVLFHLFGKNANSHYFNLLVNGHFLPQQKQDWHFHSFGLG